MFLERRRGVGSDPISRKRCQPCRRSGTVCYEMGSDPTLLHMADRLEAIEIKLAHLEAAVAEISDVVARQQKELDRALDRNQRLIEKIAAIESESGTSATAYEKPPHY